MIEKCEILRISIFDVDTGRCGSVSCWILGQQKTYEVFQFKAYVGTKDGNFDEFCAFFVKQFDFGLTYKNKISSVRLGR